jgi:hypothetical protein
MSVIYFERAQNISIITQFCTLIRDILATRREVSFLARLFRHSSEELEGI